MKNCPTFGSLRAILACFALLLVANLCNPCIAEDWRREVEALRPRDLAACETAMLDNLERRARAVLESISHARTAAEADAARPGLRTKLEHALGLGKLPLPADLYPRVVGMLRRPGYRIEKIVYEILPGERVPAHLYIPDGLGQPAPAIVLFNGHWWVEGKALPDFQALCITLARLGFVVFNFDLFGQGERGVSSRDHRRTDALLVGLAQQGFAEYEARCALEYVFSRPEIDPRRVGFTGASGGGYNTWITAALDDRIAAGVSVVGTSDFGEQIHGTRQYDWFHAAEHCHFVPGLIRFANNHELLAMAAPRPIMIINASVDKGFPVAGLRALADYGRGLYESYGVKGGIELIVDTKEGHGYHKGKREAAYGWFLRWLMKRGDGGPYAEPPVETLPADAEELRCFPAGQNEPAGPAMAEVVKRLARGLPPKSPDRDPETVLGPMPILPLAKVRIGAERLQRLVIPSEPGLEIPAFLLRPEGPIRGVVVGLDDRGKEALASEPVVQEALDQGWAVCGVDPRGIGESAAPQMMGWVFAVSLLLGEDFVGRQAWDLGRAIQVVRSVDAFANKPVGLYARGHNSALVATYVLGLRWGPDRPAPQWFVLRDGFLTFKAFYDRPRSQPDSFKLQKADRDRFTSFDREIPAFEVPFDALRHFDLPQLLAATPASGLIVDPINGDWEVMPVQEAQQLVPARIPVSTGEKSIDEFRGLLKSFK